jgi:hypothetical protein
MDNVVFGVLLGEETSLLARLVLFYEDALRLDQQLLQLLHLRVRRGAETTQEVECSGSCQEMELDQVIHTCRDAVHVLLVLLFFVSNLLVCTCRHVTNGEYGCDSGELVVYFQTIMGTEIVERLERERLVVEAFEPRCDLTLTSVPFLDLANRMISYRDHLFLARQRIYSGSLHVLTTVVHV